MRSVLTRETGLYICKFCGERLENVVTPKAVLFFFFFLNFFFLFGYVWVIEIRQLLGGHGGRNEEKRNLKKTSWNDRWKFEHAHRFWYLAPKSRPFDVEIFSILTETWTMMMSSTMNTLQFLTAAFCTWSCTFLEFSDFPLCKC